MPESLQATVYNCFLLEGRGHPRHMHWETASWSRPMQQGMTSVSISVFCFEAEQEMEQQWSSEIGLGPGQRVRRGDRSLPCQLTLSCWILRSKMSSKGWDTGIHLTPFLFSIPNRHKTLSLESDKHMYVCMYMYTYILLLGICYPKT